MASPYDSAIDMFNLPRFGAGASPFPRREDPATAARRSFLEGGSPVQDEDVFIQERASQSPDPFGVMEEVENLRREREEEGFISDIAALDPAKSDYSQSLLGLVQQNPRIAQSKGALNLVDVQRRLAPDTKDYTNQFRDPLYRASYQERVKRGLAPDAAYNETLNEAANEEMAIKLIEAGVPAERHGDLMTGGIFDRRKVAQTIASSKPNKGYDLPLSGDAKTEFETIVQDMAKAQSNSFSPSDEEKAKFLPPGKTEYSEAEWSKAWNDARAAAIEDAQSRMSMFQRTYGDYYKLPQGVAPTGPPPQASAQPMPQPKGETVAPPTASVAPAPQTPPVARDDESEKLWGEYLDLENISRVDASSTNPSDKEADREIRGEMKRVQDSLMKRLKLPDTDQGRKLFKEVWQGRKNSMAEGSDTRGALLREPLKKTGATGNSWVIRPA